MRADTDLKKNEIIERLAAVWKANPDLRLMQLLSNAFPDDPYYVEDFRMIERLEKFYEA